MGKIKINDTHIRLRKGLVDWLLAGKGASSAISFDVPVSSSSERADVVCATFPRRFKDMVARKQENLVAQRLSVSLFVCCATMREFYMEYSNSQEMTAEIARLREERSKLEEQIRREEPELRDPNVLFEELAIWDYGKSTNPLYRDIQRNIAWFEEILYNGTKMQHFQESAAADFLTIVVPEKMVQPEGFHEQWGLIWIAEDGTATLKHEPAKLDSQSGAKLMLLRKMLESNTATNVSTLNRKYRKTIKR